MTQQVPSFNFPRVEAKKCVCCGIPLTTGFGFKVPYIGTVGPKCVHKFAGLAQTLTLADGLTVPAGTAALGRLRLNLVGLGYEAQITTLDDGRWTLKIGARTRTDADKVCQTWEERREAFIQELKAAGASLEAAPVDVAPVLTEAAIAGMTLPERRSVALEHGVLTASGKASTSVVLIWAAVRAAQVAEAQAVSAVAPVVEAAEVVEVAALPAGPFEQIEQRQMTLAVQAPVPFLLPLSEEENDAALEAAAARRLALHIGEVQARERGDEVECERLYRLQGVETRHMLALTAALGQGERREQVEQRHFAQAPAVMVACEECEGEGSAWCRVGREPDGTPIEVSGTCEVCHGEGVVPVKCPECRREGVALVVSDWDAGHQWCLHCALDAIENGDGYTAAQVADIQARAVAAGILTLPQDGPTAQPEQRQAQRGAPEGYTAMLAEYRFTRQDGALITLEQRGQLDDALFELIGDFARAYRLNVEGQALFEHPDGPRFQEEQRQMQRAPADVQGRLTVAWEAYVAACEEEERLYALPERPGWEAARRARTETFGTWVLAQESWLTAMDGPHAQPEQQQAQAVAVALAAFEPECDRCGALLDTSGNCPVCAPRWRPCETGVRHAQTIPATREQAYCEHEKAHRAAHRARKAGAESARQRRLDEASQDAWTAYRRWVDADSFAAQAGAFEHLIWADL